VRALCDNSGSNDGMDEEGEEYSPIQWQPYLGWK